MCGSLKSGTLDHFLPKAVYPEFALFTKNLIPACDCNVARGEIYKGDANTKKLLHPYFDSCLTSRLIRANLQGDLLAPTISLTLCCGPIPQIESVQFHLEKVLEKTLVIKWLETKWVKLIQRPYVMLKTLSHGQLLDSQVRTALLDSLNACDDEHGTPNNWYSFFYAGVLYSAGSVRWLTDRINGINDGSISV
jgi:hypothetical protein